MADHLQQKNLFHKNIKIVSEGLDARIFELPIKQLNSFRRLDCVDRQIREYLEAGIGNTIEAYSKDLKVFLIDVNQQTFLTCFLEYGYLDGKARHVDLR